jgi:hypothetical protein
MLCVLATVASSLGCYPRATFDVTVVNETESPLTIGIVKEGPPYERELGTPGEWARDSPFVAPPQWGHLIPPGKTMDSGKVTGSFPQGALAYLRIYKGDWPNSMLIAMSQPGPDRIDILLYPGHSEFAIRKDDKGFIRATRLYPPPPAR